MPENVISRRPVIFIVTALNQNDGLWLQSSQELSFQGQMGMFFPWVYGQPDLGVFLGQPDYLVPISS
jgi:hypothetical protein